MTMSPETQDVVGLDPERDVAARVIRSHRHQPHARAAEIDRQLLVEELIGLSELRALEQLRGVRREAREPLRRLEAELVDIRLLIARANHLRVGRKPAGAEIVLGMEVRHREIQVAALPDLRHLAHDGFTVARAKPGVHDQRALAADDDADVRDERDAAVGNA